MIKKVIDKNSNEVMYSVVICEENETGIVEIPVYTSSSYEDALEKESNLYYIKIFGKGVGNLPDFYETLCSYYDFEILLNKNNKNGIKTLIIYLYDNKNLSTAFKDKEYVFSIMKILK